MANINIGRILPIFKGEYNSTTQYEKLDIVYYQGSSYVAKNSVKGILPTDTTRWQIVANTANVSDIENQIEQLNSSIFGSNDITVSKINGGYYSISGNGLKLTTATGENYYVEPINLTNYVGKQVQVTVQWITTTYASDSTRVIFSQASDSAGTTRKGAIDEKTAYAGATNKIWTYTYTVSASMPYLFMSCRNGNTVIKYRIIGGLKADVDTLNANVESNTQGIIEVENRLNKLYIEGSTTEDNFTATAGTDLSHRFNYNFKQGTTYQVKLEGEQGMIDSSGTNFRPNNSYNINLQLNGNITFTPTQDYTYVVISRGGSGIKASGDLKMTITVPEGGLISNITASKFVYVSPSGNDSNDGTKSNPFATLSKALSVSPKVIMRGGVYHNGVSLDSLSDVDVKVYAYREELPIIKLGKTIVNNGSESLVSGYNNVYSISLSSLPNSYVMYQDGVDDVTTEIRVEDMHPLQRNKRYRCDSTLIKPLTYSDTVLTTIENNVASNKYYYSYDSTNKVLYFSRPTTSSTNPIIMPNGEHCFYNASNNNISVHLLGIAMYYGNCEIMYTDNVVVEDCICKYNYSNGNFRWEKNRAVKYIRCESARCWNANGDGFNGGVASMELNPKTSTCYIIDCWSHDNNDDGYSDHDGCECRVFGGLYEFNGKAGITPSYGCSAIIDNVESRYNDRGFYYCGALRNSNPSYFAGCKFKNCYAKGNKYSGFVVEGSSLQGIGNIAICEDCTSVDNARYGYESSTTAGCTMTLRNCRASGNTKGTKSTSSIIVENADIVN